MGVQGNKATITLDMFGSKLHPFDVAEARGFSVCDQDRQWQIAQGKIVADDKIEVWSDKVAVPVAVRYAWADNPVCNLFNEQGLPVTPFRTDDFEMITKPRPVEAVKALPQAKK
jgi:sialate O-acetylesterase